MCVRGSWRSCRTRTGEDRRLDARSQPTVVDAGLPQTSDIGYRPEFTRIRDTGSPVSENLPSRKFAPPARYKSRGLVAMFSLAVPLSDRGGVSLCCPADVSGG